RLRRAPRLFDSASTRARVADLLATPAGAALASLFDEAPLARALVEGIADGSPYLWDLAERSPDRLLRLLRGDPDEGLAMVLAATVRAIAQATEDDAAMRLLRQMKSEAALLIALADLGGVWDVVRITRALTEVADAAIGAAVDYLIARAARAGKLAPPDAAHPAAGSGYIVLAMGH